MSLRYLPEHVQPLLLALDLAQKEAKHLRYSQTTLFALPIDLAWVQSLGDKPELAEKVEAFVSRFGRLQDHLGERLLPRMLALVGENSKTLLDTLATAERLDLLPSADAFIAARRLCNALVMNTCTMPRRFWTASSPRSKRAKCFLKSLKTYKLRRCAWAWYKRHEHHQRQPLPCSVTDQTPHRRPWATHGQWNPGDHGRHVRRSTLLTRP